MKLTDINPATMRGPGDEQPTERLVECSVCNGLCSEDEIVVGYLFAVCDKCDIELSRPKEEDAQ